MIKLYTMNGGMDYNDSNNNSRHNHNMDSFSRSQHHCQNSTGQEDSVMTHRCNCGGKCGRNCKCREHGKHRELNTFRDVFEQVLDAEV